MNGQTWSTLQAHGVEEGTRLRLDFFYDAPGQSEAEELASFIRTETDYAVFANGAKQGFLSKRSWTVAGSTQPTPVSLETLNQWVEWMVYAGIEHGGCRFDGWGAQAPR